MAFSPLAPGGGAVSATAPGWPVDGASLAKSGHALVRSWLNTLRLLVESIDKAPIQVMDSNKPVKGSSIVSKVVNSNVSTPNSSVCSKPAKAHSAAVPLSVGQPAAPGSAPVSPSGAALLSKRKHAVPVEGRTEPSPMHLRKEDAAAAWQPRPRMPSRLMDTYVNFMVLGACV